MSLLPPVVHASFSPGLTLPASAAVSLQVEVSISLPIQFVQVSTKSQARAKHCSLGMAYSEGRKHACSHLLSIVEDQENLGSLLMLLAK